MNCPACGAWYPDDPSTGYGGSDLCPNCKGDGFDIDASGRIIDPETSVPVKPEPVPVIEIDDDEIPF